MDIETRTQKRLISNPDDAIARAIAVDPATRYIQLQNPCPLGICHDPL